MTISSTVRKAGPFDGTGSQTEFPFEFKVFSAKDLYVVQYNEVISVETVLELDSDYTVTLNADQDNDPGGTIKLTSALAVNYTLTITSSLANLQPTDLTNRGGFYPSVINDALDRACIQIQQLQDETDRTLKTAVSVPDGVDNTLPMPAANMVIGWDNTGVALKNWSVNDLVTSVAYGSAKADIFEGDGETVEFFLENDPANINNLDVSVGGVCQVPGDDYTWISGTKVTFTVAPPEGETVLIRYMQALPQGTVDAPNVAYTASGAGAVRRTGQDKFGETVSVQDFGADPTGVVSSVTAIQNAVDTGKNVFFPSGTYLIDATITVSNNSQTLFGNGINSKLVAPTDLNGFTWFDTGASANANIEFTGLFFIGNGTPRIVNGNTGNDYVLSIQNAEAVRVINNKFEDCFAQTQAGKAVWVWAGSQNIMVANNFFANNGGQDVNFYGSNGSVYRCTAMNNIHFNTQGECYECEGRAGLTIAGYEVYDCTFIGNKIRSSIPTITAAGSHGFLCIGGRGIKYIGNTVNRRGEHGISLIGCQNVLIEGNQFQDLSRTGRNGILMNTDIFGATGSNYAVQIVGNTFANDIGNAAINCHAGDTASTSNRVIITNNQISNATTGIATGYVLDITIADNTIDNATVTTPVNIGTGTDFQKGKLDSIDTSGVLVVPYVAKTFGFSDINGAYTFDVSTGTTTFLHTLTGNITSIAHVGTPKIGMEVTLVFDQGGAFTLPLAANWTNMELAGLTAPVMMAISGRKDVIKFVWGGTRWIEICRAANVGI